MVEEDKTIRLPDKILKLHKFRGRLVSGDVFCKVEEGANSISCSGSTDDTTFRFDIPIQNIEEKDRGQFIG